MTPDQRGPLTADLEAETSYLGLLAYCDGTATKPFHPKFSCTLKSIVYIGFMDCRTINQFTKCFLLLVYTYTYLAKHSE